MPRSEQVKEAIQQSIQDRERHAGEVAKDRRICRLESQLAAANAKYDAMVRELEMSEQRVQFVDSINYDPQIDNWGRKSAARRGAATAIAVMSDWHIEENIEARTVNGRNEFNPDIASRRIKRVAEKLPEYVDRYVPMAKEIYLALIGDFITGYIHEELEESNNMSPAQAVLLTQDHIASMIQMLLRETKLRIIIPTCHGNHGRTTKKKRIATSYKNSFEWLLYHQLARYDWGPRVKWKIGDGYHNLVEIMDRTVRFHHGDAINFQGGSGGITIPVNKAIAQWNKSGHADLDVFGHFHQGLDHFNWVANGCLIGWSAFALSIKAEYQPPSQSFIVFDKAWGLRQVTRIMCDPAPTPA